MTIFFTGSITLDKFNLKVNFCFSFPFHSQSDSENPSLNLLSRLGLLSGAEVESLGGLPNLATPSDHLPLVSTFAWKYQPSSQFQ